MTHANIIDHLTSPTLATTMAGAGLVLVVLAAYQYLLAPAWAGRGIHPVLGWKIVAPAQVMAALVAAAHLAPTWGPAAAVAAAAMAWLTVLAIATDLATYKVPWDVSYPPALIGLVCFALDYTTEGAIALAAATLGLIGVPLLARWWTNKGLGLSDVRLLIALTATSTWWVGQNWLLYGLIAACVTQLGVRLLAPRYGWGRDVPILDEETGEDTGRTRRELPFAPALLLTAWAFITYATYAGYGACQMWNPFDCA